MDRIRVLAVLSVRRACGFAALAIVTVMFGLSPDPLLSLRCGAALTTLAAVVLFWKAIQAPRRDYRRTELWIMLERTPDLPPAYAGRIINSVLHEVFLSHAEAAAVIAFFMWLAAIVLRLVG